MNFWTLFGGLFSTVNGYTLPFLGNLLLPKKSGQKSTFIAANNVCALYIWNRMQMYIKSIHKSS